ncbi:hypothetical protein GPZ77_34585 (plasmid) [Streptomyces sp. QHH-9511]|uniref:hypothetical protein n=1 Tax=Streptomyces sp. QHH-9511 TaxID=2684468 RepID=UPI0013171341|nr:hypothetical protein [Streptomyces sp. QHH-9511]QGZ53359.1 hypothetical protein GPZ77_34585 [Streptomyces sp. QHH-9511]
MPKPPLPEEFHDQVRELHALGYGRNRIAREINQAPVMVSRTAEYLGLTFDRSRIEAATKARLADLAERRTMLAEDLLSDAEKLRAQMWEPTTVYSFGGKDNTYEDHTFDEAPAAEKRALMATAATAIDRLLKLVPAEDATNLDQAKSMLGSLGDALTAFSRAQDEQEDTAGEPLGGEGRA